MGKIMSKYKSRYNYNLVWIDLEMTGLDIKKDVILEIATLVTNNELDILAKGPALVINQKNEILEQMSSWCIKHHTASGLVEAVKQSTITIEEAELKTLDFLKEYKNGDLIDPMEENFMGYFIGCDEYEWTPGQVDVMRDNFFSPLRGNINLDFIPDTTHIENTHEFITPNAAETLEYYDNVFVDWTDAENANNYLVIISNSSEYHEYYTTESEIYVNDLSPDGIYFVKVKPFNDGYTDTDIINRLFRTGDLLSSSQESSILKSLNVFPNPAQTGQALNIEVNIEKSIETSIDIINMQGQRVYSQVRNLQQGANQISIETPNMPAGLYMLNIETEDGAVQRKIIIQ